MEESNIFSSLVNDIFLVGKDSRKWLTLNCLCDCIVNCSLSNGAGGENRTLVSSLENSHNQPLYDARKNWLSGWDSNPQPDPYKEPALTIEPPDNDINYQITQFFLLDG